MGSPVPKGYKAVYMRIPEDAKKKWKQLSKDRKKPMTVIFLDWLNIQRVRN